MLIMIRMDWVNCKKTDEKRGEFLIVKVQDLGAIWLIRFPFSRTVQWMKEWKHASEQNEEN